jgi:hypothetical protein
MGYIPICGWIDNCTPYDKTGEPTIDQVLEKFLVAFSNVFS